MLAKRETIQRIISMLDTSILMFVLTIIILFSIAFWCAYQWGYYQGVLDNKRNPRQFEEEENL